MVDWDSELGSLVGRLGHSIFHRRFEDNGRSAQATRRHLIDDRTLSADKLLNRNGPKGESFGPNIFGTRWRKPWSTWSRSTDVRSAVRSLQEEPIFHLNALAVRS